MARYIPTDDTARILARDLIVREVRQEFEADDVSVTIGELADDGACPVYLRAEQAEFDFRTMLDAPQVEGRAWVEAGAIPEVLCDLRGSGRYFVFLREKAAR
jgi:hypothetical protein